MKRPVPPSNFRSSGDTAEDLRRVRQHQQEILDWIDAQIDAIPAPVAGVTSFNTRTGAVVPVAGDYTKSDVGLSAVTNDAQLKRADNDWSGYTTQTGAPANGDKFLIERASDNAKRVMLASSLGSVYGFRDPVWDRPATGSVDDEEFDTDVLAGGTWTITLKGGSTGLTRDGAVDMTQAIATSHYRSTCIGSTLLIQIRQNEGVQIFKTVAGALSSHQVWVLGYGVPDDFAANTLNPQVEFNIARNTAGVPDLNNRALVRTASNTETFGCVNVTGGVVTSTTAPAVSGLHLLHAGGLFMRVNHSSAAAGNFSGGAWNRTGNHLTTTSLSALQYNLATDKVSISLTSNVAQTLVTGVNATVFALHFMRRMPAAGAWFFQS